MVTPRNPVPMPTAAPPVPRPARGRPSVPPARSPQPSKPTTAWRSSDTPAAVREFFAKPRRLAECNLVRQLFSTNATEHRRAAEMARLIGMREPGALSPYAHLLADVAASWPLAEWQARQYALVAAALAAADHDQRMRMVPLVRTCLEEERIAVRAMALEAFAVLAANEPELRDEALELLEHARHSATPALRSRARLMLPLVTTGSAGSSHTPAAKR